MNIRLLALSTAGAALLGAATASAASYTFDFLQDGANLNEISHVFDSAPGGLTVDVTGSYYTVSGGIKTDYGVARVQTNSYGLISCNPGENCRDGFDHAIDSRGPDEIMHFAFNQAVTLTGITLGWSNLGGTYYGRGKGYYDVFAGNTLLTGAMGNHTSSIPAMLSTNFSIGAHEWHGWDSAIKIRSITVDYTPSPVPLPAGGVLLLTAFGGLASLRRKRKA